MTLNQILSITQDDNNYQKNVTITDNQDSIHYIKLMMHFAIIGLEFYNYHCHLINIKKIIAVYFFLLINNNNEKKMFVMIDTPQTFSEIYFTKHA